MKGITLKLVSQIFLLFTSNVYLHDIVGYIKKSKHRSINNSKFSENLINSYFWTLWADLKVGPLFVTLITQGSVWYNNVCCVFRPANGCLARSSLVEINFLMLKQLFACFLVNNAPLVMEKLF